MPAMAPARGGKRAKEGEQEEAGEASGDDGGDGVVEGERAALAVGDPQSDERGSKTAGKNHDFAGTQPLFIRRFWPREDVKVLDGDCGQGNSCRTRASPWRSRGARR